MPDLSDLAEVLRRSRTQGLLEAARRMPVGRDETPIPERAEAFPGDTDLSALVPPASSAAAELHRLAETIRRREEFQRLRLEGPAADLFRFDPTDEERLWFERLDRAGIDLGGRKPEEILSAAKRAVLQLLDSDPVLAGEVSETALGEARKGEAARRFSREPSAYRDILYRAVIQEALASAPLDDSEPGAGDVRRASALATVRYLFERAGLADVAKSITPEEATVLLNANAAYLAGRPELPRGPGPVKPAEIPSVPLPGRADALMKQLRDAVQAAPFDTLSLAEYLLRTTRRYYAVVSRAGRLGILEPDYARTVLAQADPAAVQNPFPLYPFIQEGEPRDAVLSRALRVRPPSEDEPGYAERSRAAALAAVSALGADSTALKDVDPEGLFLVFQAWRDGRDPPKRVLEIVNRLRAAGVSYERRPPDFVEPGARVLGHGPERVRTRLGALEPEAAYGRFRDEYYRALEEYTVLSRAERYGFTDPGATEKALRAGPPVASGLWREYASPARLPSTVALSLYRTLPDTLRSLDPAGLANVPDADLMAALAVEASGNPTPDRRLAAVVERLKKTGDRFDGVVAEVRKITRFAENLPRLLEGLAQSARSAASDELEEARAGTTISQQLGKAVEDILAPVGVLFLAAEDYLLRPGVRWLMDRVVSDRWRLQAGFDTRKAALEFLGLKDQARLLEEGRRLGLLPQDLSALVPQEELDAALERKWGVWHFLERGSLSAILTPVAIAARVASPMLFGVPTSGAALLVPSTDLSDSVARYSAIPAALLGVRPLRWMFRELGGRVDTIRAHILYSGENPAVRTTLLELARKAGRSSEVKRILEEVKQKAGRGQRYRLLARERAYLERTGGDPARVVSYGYAVDPVRTVELLDPSGYWAARTPGITQILSAADYDAAIRTKVLASIEEGMRGRPSAVSIQAAEAHGLDTIWLLLSDRRGRVVEKLDQMTALLEASIADLDARHAELVSDYARMKAHEAAYSQTVKRVNVRGFAKYLREVEPEFAPDLETAVARIRSLRKEAETVSRRRSGLGSELAGLEEIRRDPELEFAPKGVAAPRELTSYLLEHPEIVEELAAHDPRVAAAVTEAGRVVSKGGKVRELPRTQAVKRYLRTSLALEDLSGSPLEMFFRDLESLKTQVTLRTGPLRTEGASVRPIAHAISRDVGKHLEADFRRVKNTLVSMLRAPVRLTEFPALVRAVRAALRTPGLRPEAAIDAALKVMRERAPEALARPGTRPFLERVIREYISTELEFLRSLRPGTLSRENIRELEQGWDPHYYRHFPPQGVRQLAPTPEAGGKFFSAPLRELTTQRGLEGAEKPWRVVYRRLPEAQAHSAWFATEAEAMEFINSVRGHKGSGEAWLYRPVSLEEQHLYGLSDDAIRSRFEGLLQIIRIHHQQRLQQFLVDNEIAVDEPVARLRDPALVMHLKFPSVPEMGALAGKLMHKEAVVALKAASDYSSGLREMYRGFIEALSASGMQTQIDELLTVGEVAKGLRGGLRAATQLFRSVAMTSWILFSPRTWISQFVYNSFLALVGFRLTPMDLFHPAFRRGVLRLTDPTDPFLVELQREGVALDMPYYAGSIERALGQLRKTPGARERRQVLDLINELFSDEPYQRAQRAAKAIDETVKKITALTDEKKRERLVPLLDELKRYQEGYNTLSREWAGSMLQKVERRARILAEHMFIPYTAVDAMYKVGTAELLRERGMPVKEIAWQIRQFYQAYSDVPPTIRALARSPVGAMIPTFPYEFLRIGMNLIRYRWPELTMALMAVQAANHTGLALDGMTWEDHVALHSRGNDQLATVRGAFALHVPGGYDVDLGALMGLDVFTMGHGLTGYIGYELQKQNGFAPAIGAALANTVSNFVLNQPMINSVFSFALNRDSFTRRPIIDDSSGQMDKFLYLLKQYFPSWVPWSNYDTYWSRRLYGDVFERSTGEPRPGALRVLSFLGIDDSSRKAAVAQVIRNAQRLAAGGEGWRAALLRKDGEIERAAMGVLLAQPGDKATLMREYIRLGREAHPRTTPGQLFRMLERKIRTGPAAYVFADATFRAQTYALADLARRGMDRYPEWNQMLRAYLGGDDALAPTRETVMLSLLSMQRVPTPPELRQFFGRLSRVSDADLTEAIDLFRSTPAKRVLAPIASILELERQRRRLGGLR